MPMPFTTLENLCHSFESNQIFMVSLKNNCKTILLNTENCFDINAQVTLLKTD